MLYLANAREFEHEFHQYVFVRFVATFVKIRD